MAKRWHQFVPGTACNRDEIVAVCEMHLQSGRLRNPVGEEAWFDKIRRCPHDRLVWAPFGSSWGLSPMNPNAWRTETGEAIWERHVIPNVAKGQPVNPQPRAHSQADRMATTWLDGYYEALKFFYWEPQHIGRKKDVARPVINLEKVMKHLRSMEVTLNHNINQFLLLAPIALRARSFHEFFRTTFDSQNLRCTASVSILISYLAIKDSLTSCSYRAATSSLLR